VETELDDKVAWVLGASSGIGRAVAHSLAAEGARVAISARNRGRLEQTATAIETETQRVCRAFPLDVTEREAIYEVHKEIASDLGTVKILVSNAGGPPAGTFDSLDEKQLRAAFELTLESAWHLAQAVRPDMEREGGGCIIFLTSTSVKEPIPNLLFSNMMRPAVVGMAKTMSQELGPAGIRVCCVAPGRIDTPRIEELHEVEAQESGKTPAEVRAARESKIPLRRYGRPEEVGEVVAFLASERASYMTGITVAVDGGALSGLLS
jgi:3-oxoacyl-[acyl-carrier protein] reductase